ncbi:hypothetical protein BY458DRAFT_3842 [Sporodiniella umbellata]|nr:hypothetical protein BY458DRAFT_3842 [Sporodiniella umbellata]
MSKEKRQNPILHLTGGALSGMVACVALQPLDLIKTRLQQQRQDHLAFIREAKNKGLIVAPFKSNIYSTIKDIVQHNGYSGLWRETSLALRSIFLPCLKYDRLYQTLGLYGNLYSTFKKKIHNAGKA